MQKYYDQKYAVSVKSWTQRCYRDLVKIFITTTSNIPVPAWELYKGIQEILEHLHTFQLFIHASKTTNLWSQQHFSSWSDVMYYWMDSENY